MLTKRSEYDDEDANQRLSRQQVITKFAILPKTNLTQSMVVTDPKILSQFKYRLTGKGKAKLKAKYPIISGHILEHYLRYGKPPFKNFGCIKNVKWCRYGD